jgi:hypothetical protein
VNAAPEAGAQRQIRLFAMDECVIGRFNWSIRNRTCCSPTTPPTARTPTA